MNSTPTHEQVRRWLRAADWCKMRVLWKIWNSAKIEGRTDTAFAQTPTSPCLKTLDKGLCLNVTSFERFSLNLQASRQRLPSQISFLLQAAKTASLSLHRMSTERSPVRRSQWTMLAASSISWDSHHANLLIVPSLRPAIDKCTCTIITPWEVSLCNTA